MIGMIQGIPSNNIPIDREGQYNPQLIPKELRCGIRRNLVYNAIVENFHFLIPSKGHFFEILAKRKYAVKKVLYFQNM